METKQYLKCSSCGHTVTIESTWNRFLCDQLTANGFCDGKYEPITKEEFERETRIENNSAKIIEDGVINQKEIVIKFNKPFKKHDIITYDPEDGIYLDVLDDGGLVKIQTKEELLIFPTEKLKTGTKYFKIGSTDPNYKTGGYWE